MSSVRAKVMTTYWDEVSCSISQHHCPRSLETFFDVHFTDPDATLRLCVSFLLMAPMGEPMHRLSLRECFPVSRFCFCFLRLHMPL